MKPFLELRSSVNKMIGQFNSQEWDVKIIASDPRDFVTFQVCLYLHKDNLSVMLKSFTFLLNSGTTTR